MPTLQPYHLRRIESQRKLFTDWPDGSDGEMRLRWYPLYCLLRSPYFTEWEVVRLVELKDRQRQGQGQGQGQEIGLD